MGLFGRGKGREDGAAGGSEDLSAAVYAGDADWARELIRAGADVNARDDFGLALLHQAVSGGSVEVVRLLTGGGADVNARDGSACTPLHHAARKRAGAGLVLALIKAGADVNARDEADCWPLQTAASEGQADAARLLVEAGSDVNTEGSTHPAPLLLAAMHGHKQVVSVLLQAGADLTVRSEHGDGPLDAAAYAGAADVVRLLLRAGADPEATNAEGRTALDIAVAEGHDSVAALLRGEQPAGERASGLSEADRDFEIRAALSSLVRLGSAGARRRGTAGADALGHIQRQIVEIGEHLMDVGDAGLVDAVHRRLEDGADAATVREVTLAWKSGLGGWST